MIYGIDNISQNQLLSPLATISHPHHCAAQRCARTIASSYSSTRPWR